MTARIAPLVARFKQSTSGDVVANKVYIEADPSTYTLDLNEVGEILSPVPDPDGFTRIDIAKLANDDPRDFPEGTYDVYITALDAAGNESSPLEIQNAVFDFTPPESPSDGTIENS